MWHFISEQISDNVGHDFICDDIREVKQGDTHKAYKISDGRHRYFIKLNDSGQLANFSAEAEGLSHLKACEVMRVPTVICHGVVEDHSFLVLEHITMQDGDKDDWFTFGQQLALLHKNQTQEMYGWQDDNYIGQTPQPNQWHKKWARFFAEQRIGYMLQLLAERGESLPDIDRCVEATERLLHGHQPVASLLHGDLWSGNTGFHQHQAVLFDPAMYYGDREADIAMTELFGKFPQAFYDGYNDQWALDEHYSYRKPVYQLYHILNHAVMFGGQYLTSAKATLNTLDA
ncbi:fructosamine kinase family protein [Aestuariibacter halophilus]|uniref:Fructosamine kinase family protein n=1 Tax=Fluctibacter halophilus TaxID=226011 RepID=A0ABS8G668_9ALTE|nr:fructosamine kinase family protein [Aestuariibacter halophilus]MCC2615903.1 fructosamine kinase family protein [Aestuariibacter halophilus]